MRVPLQVPKIMRHLGLRLRVVWRQQWAVRFEGFGYDFGFRV